MPPQPKPIQTAHVLTVQTPLSCINTTTCSPADRGSSELPPSRTYTLGYQRCRSWLKGHPSQDACWPEMVENVQRCPPASFIGCCINIYTRVVLFCFCCCNFKPEPTKVQPCLFALYQGWPVAYFLRLPHVSALFVTWLVETAGYNITALTVVFARFWNVALEQTGPEIEWKSALCLFSLIPFLSTGPMMIHRFGPPLTSPLPTIRSLSVSVNPGVDQNTAVCASPAAFLNFCLPFNSELHFPCSFQT